MDLASLEERHKKLEVQRRLMASTPLVTLRLDLLDHIIQLLKNDIEARDLFGDNVLQHMALVLDKATNQIMIADANIGEITPDEELKFLKHLKEIIMGTKYCPKLLADHQVK